MENQAEAYDFIVLGAGVAGLSFAYEVALQGHKVLVLEKDARVGGLSRTLDYKGFRFDYCAHRFHSGNPDVMNRVKGLVGEGFKRHTKKSRIFMFDKYLKYPFELQNLLRAMKPLDALVACFSFGFNHFIRTFGRLLGGKKKRFRSYEQWFVHHFGKKLYRIMCEPYTTKIWKTSPAYLSADWADQRFQGIKVRQLIKRVIQKLLRLDFSSYSIEDDSLAPDGGDFYYGENGAQDIPDAYEREILKLGSEILTGVKVTEVDEEDLAVHYKHEGQMHIARGGRIISTIPLHTCYQLMERSDPAVEDELEKIRYMDIIFVYLLLDKETVSNDHWLYYPDEDIIFNRSVEFKTWSSRMAPPDKTALCLDITCYEGDPTWEMSNDQLVEACHRSVEKAQIARREEVYGSLVIRVKHAYPYYDLDYLGRLKKVVGFIEQRQRVFCLGRTGVFRYNNSDGSVEMGMVLARNLTSKPPMDDPSVLSHVFEYHSY